jgi:hypothetical protein
MPLILKIMTVQIDIDEKQWVEAQALAKELNVDYAKVLIKALRASLYSLRRAKQKAMSTAEKEKQHRESYEKYPVQLDEFFVDEEQLNEAWKDL